MEDAWASEAMHSVVLRWALNDRNGVWTCPSTSPRQGLRRVESGHLLHLLSMTGIGAMPPSHLIASQGHAHSRGVRSRSRSPYC